MSANAACDSDFVAEYSEITESTSAIIDNYSDTEDKDCDITYKADYNVYNSSAFSQIHAISASNDDKNTPKYHPTALQDVYPTDLA